MNCKDCIHTEVCKFTDKVAPLSDSIIKESNCVEKRCPFFRLTFKSDDKKEY